MINHNYIFPTKISGPSNCIGPDSKFHGTDNWTWNWESHWPVITIAFGDSQTGKSLVAGAGSSALAQAELLKIAKLSRIYIMNKIPLIARNNLEYRVAKDEDVLNTILLFQIEILQTWGGYQSLYRVTDTENKQSIGKSAELFIQGTDLFSTYYIWKIPTGNYRSGY